MKQKSREAIIELLFLSLYLDGHVSLAEDSVLNEALESLGWESEQSRENHVFEAFSAAREAANCELKTAEFLKARADVIHSDGGEGEALTWLSRVLDADGLTYSEKEFLKSLQLQLYGE